MINFYLGAALGVAPFFILYKTGMQTSAVVSQEYFFMLTAALGVLLFGAKTNRRIKLMALMLLALAFTPNNPFGLYQYYQLLLCISGVAFIALVYGQRRNLEHDLIPKCLGLICLLESGWIILQYFHYSPHTILLNYLNPAAQVKVLSGSEIFGSMGNINHAGALIACTIPFLRIRYWIIPFIALSLTTTMPAISAAAGIVTYYSCQQRKYLPVILGVIALALAALALIFYPFTPGTYFWDSHRIEAWTAILNEVGLQFWGKGMGWMPEVFAKKLIAGMAFRQAHNEWLELYAVAGLLGVVAGVYLILPVFKNRGNPKLNACLIALLVNSLGNFTFHIAPLFMIFGACYALQLAKE